MKRNTIQRSLTLEAVRKLKDHPTADEIYTEVSSKYPTISRGTIYRNLNQLAESGKIRVMDIPGGAGHYDDRCDDHYHVQCIHCGKVFDVDMEYIPDLSSRIHNMHGFKISGYELIFKGICPACQKNC